MATNVKSFQQARRRRAASGTTPVQFEMPTWLLRVLEYRVAAANEGAPEDEVVDLQEVMEWHFISPITVGEVPLIEQAAPGTAAALTEWIESSVYAPGK